MAKLVFLLPLAGLIVFWLFPLPLAGGIYGILVVVSIVLYFGTTQSKTGPSKVGAQELIGATGVVQTWSDNKGLVEIHDELWAATSSELLHEGQYVEVMSVNGLHVRVRSTQKEH